MDLRKMRYFVGIVEAGSLTAASDLLRVAQPTLSSQLAQMEEELDTPLMHRLPRGLEPTEAGRLLYEKCRAILAEVEDAMTAVRSQSGRVGGTVRIGLPSTINGVLAVPLVLRAKDELPGVRIVIAEAMSGFVQRWVVDGGVDLGIIYAEDAIPGLSHRPLFREDLSLILPKEAAVQGWKEILQTADFILPGEAHGLRRTIDIALASMGLRLSCRYEVDSFQNMKDFVAAGLGASILPSHTVAREVAEGKLVAIPFTDPPIFRIASLVVPTLRPETAAVRAVIQLLATMIPDLIGSGMWQAIDPPRKSSA